MNEVLARTAVMLNPLIAVLIALAGTAVGGVLGGPLGVIVGLIGGGAIATALCGNVALLASALQGADAPQSVAAAAGQAPVAQARATASAVPAYAANGHAVSGQTQPAPTVPAGAAALASTVPAAAGIAPEVIEATETEAQLLALGKFDAYHLTKAKRLFAAGNMKEAAYQAGASMSHVDSTEAAALRKAALASASAAR